MTPMTSKSSGALLRTLLALGGLASLCAAPARAEVPGIGGPSFNLVASADYISQPDGASIYSWGYGCDGAPSRFLPARPAYAQGPQAGCLAMQLPGPTLVVTEGDLVTVTLRNNLPAAAGNTSILFPGFAVATGGTGVAGMMTQEAASGGTVTYSFVATTPGTHAYYSGTQADLQIEMGLYGALIVRPKAPPPGCSRGDFSHSASAYGNASTCYDREYLFQISEMDSRIHASALAQVQACPASTAARPCPAIRVVTEPYRPNYFLLNGRSMPDVMDTNYAPNYVHQPYNANPHMHPGELLLMRIIGQGRWQHPFHFHGNHARVLARDGNLMVSKADGVSLAGPLLFTTPTVSGQTQDQIFSWTGKGLNWDVYNHRPGDGSVCMPDANGFHGGYTGGVKDANFGEWCADHGKPIPVVPPDPNIVAIGQWYGGTPYLGLQTTSQGFTTTTEPPGTLNQNPQAGYAYMWHSHNEREITTNDVFPGGILSMLLIDPPTWLIDETL